VCVSGSWSFVCILVDLTVNQAFTEYAELCREITRTRNENEDIGVEEWNSFADKALHIHRHSSRHASQGTSECKKNNIPTRALTYMANKAARSVSLFGSTKHESEGGDTRGDEGGDGKRQNQRIVAGPDDSVTRAELPPLLESKTEMQRFSSLSGVVEEYTGHELDLEDVANMPIVFSVLFDIVQDFITIAACSRLLSAHSAKGSLQTPTKNPNDKTDRVNPLPENQLQDFLIPVLQCACSYFGLRIALATGGPKLYLSDSVFSTHTLCGFTDLIVLRHSDNAIVMIIELKVLLNKSKYLTQLVSTTQAISAGCSNSWSANILDDETQAKRVTGLLLNGMQCLAVQTNGRSQFLASGVASGDDFVPRLFSILKHVAEHGQDRAVSVPSSRVVQLPGSPPGDSEEGGDGGGSNLFPQRSSTSNSRGERQKQSSSNVNTATKGSSRKHDQGRRHPLGMNHADKENRNLNIADLIMAELDSNYGDLGASMFGRSSLARGW
jgi:hypothetical protein